jgi:hypothetical protein
MPCQPGDGKVFANLTDISEIVEIDARTATAGRRWSTAPCKQPVPIAIDKAHHRLFSGCRSGVLTVSDYDAGKVIATVSIGAGVDGAGYDADYRMFLPQMLEPDANGNYPIPCGWHAYRDPSRQSRSTSRVANPADAHRVTQPGA